MGSLVSRMMGGSLGLRGLLAELKDVSFRIKPIADGEVLEAPLVGGRIEAAAELTSQSASGRQIGDEKNGFERGLSSALWGMCNGGAGRAGRRRHQHDKFERLEPKEHVFRVGMQNTKADNGGIERADARSIGGEENGSSVWKGKHRPSCGGWRRTVLQANA